MGPPHPESHIRPIQVPILPTDTPQTAEFKHFWQSTMEWHSEKWQINNHQYFTELAQFEDSIVQRFDRPATDQDRAEFYKIFLDERHQDQTAYYWEWIARLVKLCSLGMKSWWSQRRVKSVA
ncbi:hypothetical protein BCR44DRAFT_1427463 [Catenaria anguillulae PL171]|uniref:Uncharacterized protein n=1 Tax=Catenaria anguillulae PL171 TaxID=765915 RepID=A0A1Y2HX76_9FUNG|nr:hypothetical protein BCR44DRAFT_1427463 [Catenaria anguillulae PL171]